LWILPAHLFEHDPWTWSVDWLPSLWGPATLFCLRNKLGLSDTNSTIKIATCNSTKSTLNITYSLNYLLNTILLWHQSVILKLLPPFEVVYNQRLGAPSLDVKSITWWSISQVHTKVILVKVAHISDIFITSTIFLDTTIFFWTTPIKRDGKNIYVLTKLDFFFV